MNEDDVKKLASSCEAILFVSGEPLRTDKLKEILNCSMEDLECAINFLDKRLIESGSGLCLLRAPEGIQLITNKNEAEKVDLFLKNGIREQLSPAAAETLAIVAYRGPIHRAGVEAIRGVNCSFSLRLLSMRGLIERFPNEKDSRIFMYRISAEFLRYLGLSRVEDLPDYQNFRQHEGMTNLQNNSEAAVIDNKETK